MSNEEHISKIIKSDFTGLNNFVKAVGGHGAVDVGIMGQKTNRKNKNKSGQSNADIGFIHEFGTNRIPKRSFLRMPLFLKSEQILKEVKEAGALKKVMKGNFQGVLKDLGYAAEKAVLQAFDTSGFGSWAAKKDGEASHLVKTGQLRRSISSAVVNL